MFVLLQYVDEKYDIPRSHQLPYTRYREEAEGASALPGTPGSRSTSRMDGNASGATVILSDAPIDSASPSKHYYTNAAPTSVEGNVFRYDFDDKVCNASLSSESVSIPSND